MLVLKRKEGQWVEITHKSGDTIRIHVYNIRARHPGQLDVAFEDAARNFEIHRPERVADAAGPAPTPTPTAPRRPLGRHVRRRDGDPAPAPAG